MQSVQHMKGQGGFTLIELIAVIVILGILAAVATPKFIDMSDEASESAVEAVAGNISSGASMNFAAAQVKNKDAVELTDCENAEDVLEEEELEDKYELSGDTASETGDSMTCTVEDTENGKTAEFDVLAVSADDAGDAS